MLINNVVISFQCGHDRIVFPEERSEIKKMERSQNLLSLDE